MERPSHISFARHSSLSRTPWIGLAITLQLAGFWLFTHGLSTTISKFIPTEFTVEPIKQDDLPRPTPPPLPRTKDHIDTVTATTPIFDYPSGDPRPTFFKPTDPSPQPPTQPRTEAVGRPAVGITTTHTVPPYPPIARRLGLEGMVTLRLTVGTDGRVSAAEIVTSAGRDDLDQAARDWIIAHWRYRPALKDGTPAAAQVLASVTYNLKNQP